MKPLLTFVGILAIIGVRLAVRSYQQSERQHSAHLDQFVPALHSMSPEAIADSEWAYTGPLGELTLRFEPNGTLAVVNGGTEETGSWVINDVMLIVQIPGADSPHQAVFRKSTNELSGISPKGMQPHKWTAIRTQ